MQQPAHQILADDVVIDRGQAIARAEVSLVGRAEMAVGCGRGLATANHVDEPVMGEREQRGQLRQDGVVVVAGIGEQRFGPRHAHARNAAVDPGDILGLRSRDIAERTAGLDVPVLPAHAAEPQFGAALVACRILRENSRTADRTAAEQGFQPKRGAARVGVFSAELARHRERHRRLHEIVGDELQQIGVTGGKARGSPNAGSSHPGAAARISGHPSAATAGSSIRGFFRHVPARPADRRHRP